MLAASLASTTLEQACIRTYATRYLSPQSVQASSTTFVLAASFTRRLNWARIDSDQMSGSALADVSSYRATTVGQRCALGFISEPCEQLLGSLETHVVIMHASLVLVAPLATACCSSRDLKATKTVCLTTAYRTIAQLHLDTAAQQSHSRLQHSFNLTHRRACYEAVRSN